MSLEPKVYEIICTAISNLNEELRGGQQIPLSPETLLFGGDSTIDSLSLVSVIVDVETALSSDFNTPLSLTDDRAMSREVSPFTSVRSLADYILELLGETQA